MPKESSFVVIIAYRIELANGKVLQGWLLPDPAEQFHNPYLAMGNNPVMYVDPDGEFVWIPVIIGAAIGAYIGGSTANQSYNPGNWDFQSGKTWGYMIGGAVVGGLSGAASYAVATSGIPFANTASIMTGSFTNSLGMNIVTQGQTDVNISFGAASYNFTQNEWGYLGKEGNSTIENIGYSIGALANISDGVGLFDQIRANNRNNLTPAQKQTQYENNYQEGWYDEYIGPNGNADPVVTRANGNVPQTPLGEAGYQHDVAYYNQGADGARGAVFNTRTLAADRALISSARSIRQSFKNGADIALQTYKWAGKVRMAFVPLVGYKYTLTNYYLFAPLTLRR
ncbi:hypothetical protein G3O08_20155 [Cryomorpha ignava]|uniref:RHS repeat-associated core domain-containing protein n=1 Tax=Cryomorpha ignava TaxID=101383 RepID=A0A7K3WWA5_9FLAO|nr:hypothetical protein [Cryomorpha ignava]NEN25806.1 hypothetical protein [Cryomorpha ignava]